LTLFTYEDFVLFQKLADDKVTLNKRHETFKKMLKEKTELYEKLKARLDDNETYAQVSTHTHRHMVSSPLPFSCLLFHFKLIKMYYL